MAENGWARCPQPQKNTGVPRCSQVFSICKRYNTARLRLDTQPPPVTTQKKQSSKRRPLLVGLPGFVLRKDIFEVEPIPLKKKAQTAGRAINHFHIGSTIPRENQAVQQRMSPNCRMSLAKTACCYASAVLCVACNNQSTTPCIDARRAFASAIIQFAYANHHP